MGSLIKKMSRIGSISFVPRVMVHNIMAGTFFCDIALTVTAFLAKLISDLKWQYGTAGDGTRLATSDSWLDSWLVTRYSWLVTYWLVTRDLLTRDSWPIDSWIATSDSWLVTNELFSRDSWTRDTWLVNSWLMTHDSCRVTRDLWLVTRELMSSWLVTRDSWLVTRDSWTRVVESHESRSDILARGEGSARLSRCFFFSGGCEQFCGVSIARLCSDWRNVLHTSIWKRLLRTTQALLLVWSTH